MCVVRWHRNRKGNDSLYLRRSRFARLYGQRGRLAERSLFGDGALNHKHIFRPDGVGIVFRTQHNSPMPGTYSVAMTERFDKSGNLLGALARESQAAANAVEVANSTAFGIASSELIEAVGFVRDQWLKTAREAGLANATFDPAENAAAKVSHYPDDRGRQHPLLSFTLVASSDDPPARLTVNGEVVRTLRDSFNFARYAFSPLELTITEGGRDRDASWQALATPDFGDPDGWIEKVDYRAYSVNPIRLGQEIAQLFRASQL